MSRHCTIETLLPHDMFWIPNVMLCKTIHIFLEVGLCVGGYLAKNKMSEGHTRSMNLELSALGKMMVSMPPTQVQTFINVLYFKCKPVDFRSNAITKITLFISRGFEGNNPKI